VAVPIEPVPDSIPSVEVNGATLTFAAPGRSADFAGIRKPPYKISTPWSAMYYFKASPDVIAQLGEASDLSIHVVETGKSGPVQALFAAKVQGDARLKEFASR
jgi:hypothetical protein